MTQSQVRTKTMGGLLSSFCSSNHWKSISLQPLSATLYLQWCPSTILIQEPQTRCYQVPRKRFHPLKSSWLWKARKCRMWCPSPPIWWLSLQSNSLHLSILLRQPSRRKCSHRIAPLSRVQCSPPSSWIAMWRLKSAQCMARKSFYFVSRTRSTFAPSASTQRICCIL